MPHVKPNFLIVGAAKAGSTSLYRYLDQHEQVFLSPVKEPLYFVGERVAQHTVDPWMRKVLERHPEGRPYLTDPEAYYTLFEGAEPRHRAIGEASASYLYYHDVAIPRIWRELGDVKIIIILRDPVKKAISQYRFLKRKDNEPLAFGEALEREEERMARNYCALYQYVAQGRYYAQVKAYLDRFSQVKVLLNEDLSADPQAVMSELFAFLGVDDLQYEAFGRHNRTAFAPKNYRLHRLLNAAPVKRVRRQVLERVAPQLVARWKSAYLKRNEAGQDVDETARERLVEAFRADTRRLEELIGRSLQHWNSY